VLYLSVSAHPPSFILFLSNSLLTTAPIFAAINRRAWDVAQFPSTNWYSDNIICHDLNKAGYQHFVSRGYVHHAGSQTVGNDFAKCHEEPREWIKTNRPDMYEAFYGRDS